VTYRLIGEQGVTMLPDPEGEFAWIDELASGPEAVAIRTQVDVLRRSMRSMMDEIARLRNERDYAREQYQEAANAAGDYAVKLKAAEEVIARAREIHGPVIVLGGGVVPCRAGCGGWPCKTIRALDGELA